MNTIKLRSLYESRVKQTNGRWRFLTEMRKGLGLCDKEGNDHRDLAGNRTLKSKEVTPEQFSLQELAEAIIGPSWHTLFNPDSQALSRYTTARSLVEVDSPTRIGHWSRQPGSVLIPVHS